MRISTVYGCQKSMRFAKIKKMEQTLLLHLQIITKAKANHLLFSKNHVK